jgi:Tfp pilus assembly PilM family ATPase
MFPQQVLLEFHDHSLRGQVLGDGLQPGALSIDAPLPALTCRRGMPLEKEPLGDLIGDLMVRDNLIEPIVMAALPPAAVQCRVLEWWPLREALDDPMESLLRIEPSLNLPFPLQEACIDLQPLPGTGPVMLLAAAPRKLLDAWIQVFNMAGVRLERLAPAQSCQLAALNPLLEGAPSDQLIALVDAGPEDRRLLLIRQALPVFEWELPADDDALVAEVNRCVSFYRRRDPAVRAVRLLLAQPFPRQQELERQLGVAAEELTADPFDSLVLQGLAIPEGLP